MPKVAANKSASLLTRLFRPDARTRNLVTRTRGAGDVAGRRVLNQELARNQESLERVQAAVSKKGKKIHMDDRNLLRQRNMLEEQAEGLRRDIRGTRGERYSKMERLKRGTSGVAHYMWGGNAGQMAARNGAAIGGIVGVGAAVDGINGGYGD